jgi:hypothetical protein
LLRSDRESERAVADVLGAFVESGWAETVQLAYRLSEVYR